MLFEYQLLVYIKTQFKCHSIQWADFNVFGWGVFSGPHYTEKLVIWGPKDRNCLFHQICNGFLFWRFGAAWQRKVCDWQLIIDWSHLSLLATPRLAMPRVPQRKTSGLENMTQARADRSSAHGGAGDRLQGLFCRELCSKSPFFAEHLPTPNATPINMSDPKSKSKSETRFEKLRN